MSRGRSLVLIAVLAAIHGAFFIVYLAPEWPTVADQEGYRRLGRALADSGRFTRFDDSPEFVPEVIRTPGYPLFLALVYGIAGDSFVAVAIAQTLVFIALVFTVYIIARACGPPRVALGAALLAALYPTFPYFAALTMTELWTTFVLTLAIAATLRAERTRAGSDFALAGFLLGYTALSRPAFVLLPLALAGTGLVMFRQHARPLLRPWLLVLGVFALTLLPWFAFNYAVMGRFALAPAGGVGRGLWEGSWHGRWPGRLHDQLTQIAAGTPDPQTLDRRVEELAARSGRDPGPMRTYVHQWQDIRQLWDAPTDPQERAVARITADNEYRRVALDNIGADLAGHIWRRLTHGALVLWTTDIWLRYSAIDDAPPLLVRGMWALQAILIAFGIWGAVCLLRQRRWVAAWLLITPLLYVTAVHVPLLTEARQSLPVKPLLLVLTAIGVADVTRRLFPLEAQVHKGEHV